MLGPLSEEAGELSAEHFPQRTLQRLRLGLGLSLRFKLTSYGFAKGLKKFSVFAKTVVWVLDVGENKTDGSKQGNHTLSVTHGCGFFFKLG